MEGKGQSIGGTERQRVKKGRQVRRRRRQLRRFLFGVTIALCCVTVLYIRGLKTRLKEMERALAGMKSSGVQASADIWPENSGSTAGLDSMDSGQGAAGVSSEDGELPKMDYADSIPEMDIDRDIGKPVKRTREEAVRRLKELGEEVPELMKICGEESKYPDNLLIALANNPEMAGFVEGYLGRPSDGDDRAEGTGRLTSKEKEAEFPLLLQWDPRWGYEEYGDGSMIGLSGCGPTCLSMVLFALTRDEAFTPDKIAEYSIKNGYYVKGEGTSWALMDDLPRLYGIEAEELGMSEAGMKGALDKGEIMICSMFPGDFTATGHFIVIYGYGQEGFLVNDPNCVARSRKAWDYGELKGQIRKIWVYSDGDDTQSTVMERLKENVGKEIVETEVWNVENKVWDVEKRKGGVN